MINRHNALAAGLLSLTLCFAPAAQAEIQYQLTSQGSDLWTFHYTLDTTGAPSFDEFTIYFDRTTVQEIISFTAPTGWDTLFVQADPDLPADGFVDALYVGGGALAAGPVAGFSVGVRMLAGMVPAGPQVFEFAVSDPFAVVHTGMTSAVPEPATPAIMLAGLGLLALALRKGQGSRHQPATACLGDAA